MNIATKTPSAKKTHKPKIMTRMGLVSCLNALVRMPRTSEA
jgi:hypothetical protein